MNYVYGHFGVWSSLKFTANTWKKDLILTIMASKAIRVVFYSKQFSEQNNFCFLTAISQMERSKTIQNHSVLH